MVATATCQALLVIFLIDLVQRCNGYLHQKPQIISKALPKWKLRCSESVGTPPTSTPSKRSSMNEKMLERAKKLRDEALELEGLNSNTTSAADTKVEIVQASSSAVKTSRDEFVSRFPVERLTANTSIFTLGAFVSNTTKADSVSNGTYVSVLAERTSDRANQKLKLDKLSGEVTRKKNIAAENIPKLLSEGPVSVAPVKVKAKVPEPEMINEVLNIKGNNAVGSALGAAIGVCNRTVLFNALDQVCNSDTSVSSVALQNCLREVIVKGETKYVLVDPAQQERDFSFWPATVLFKFLSWLVFIDVDKNIPENKADLKYLETAFLSNMRDLTMAEKDETNIERFTALLEDLGRSQFQLRADFLKASCTGDIPDVAELEDLIARRPKPRENEDTQDEMTLWRQATLNRLLSKKVEASLERKLLWGLVEERKSSSVSVMTPPMSGDTPFEYPAFAPYPPTAELIAANTEKAAAALREKLINADIETLSNTDADTDGDEVDLEFLAVQDRVAKYFNDNNFDDDEDDNDDTEKYEFNGRGGTNVSDEEFLELMKEEDKDLLDRVGLVLAEIRSSNRTEMNAFYRRGALLDIKERNKMGPIGPALKELLKTLTDLNTASNSGSSVPGSSSVEVSLMQQVEVKDTMDSNKNETKTFEDLSKMTVEEVLEFLKLDDDSNVKEMVEKYVKVATDMVSDNFADTAAERFVVEYFDVDSWRDGLVISREGAGRFQAEMLNELFVVTSVEMSHGAVIFNGRYKTKDSAEFAKKLSERYDGSRISDEVGYTVMMNERYPTLEGGMQQAALDQLLGRAPAIVVFPKTWNSTAVANAKKSPRTFIKSTLASLAAVSSAAFAAIALDMLNPESTFITTGLVPDDFLPLAFMPLTIQYTSALAETIVGNIKGFNVTSLVVPAFSLPTYGSRSIYTSMPKNRDDIFDAAAAGLIVALASSLLALYTGLQITAEASPEVVAGYPAMSLALLNTNAVVTQFLNYQLPQAAVLAREVAATTVGITADPTTVHLHWLAIAGAVSFMANTLQLIPVDNSAGSKLALSVLGQEVFTIISLFTGAIKFLFVLPMLFTLNAGVVTTPRLLFDFFVTSQIFGSEEVRLSVRMIPLGLDLS